MPRTARVPPALHQAIVTAVTAGVPYHQAAHLVGVSTSTVQELLQRGAMARAYRSSLSGGGGKGGRPAEHQGGANSLGRFLDDGKLRDGAVRGEQRPSSSQHYGSMRGPTRKRHPMLLPPGGYGCGQTGRQRHGISRGDHHE
jgi:hypothetical protein